MIVAGSAMIVVSDSNVLITLRETKILTTFLINMSYPKRPFQQKWKKMADTYLRIKTLKLQVTKHKSLVKREKLVSTRLVSFRARNSKLIQRHVLV